MIRQAKAVKRRLRNEKKRETVDVIEEIVIPPVSDGGDIVNDNDNDTSDGGDIVNDNDNDTSEVKPT